jgi:hypothetical protein
MRSTFPTYAFDSLSISAVARSVLNSPPRCCGEDQCLKPVARLTKSKVFGFPEPLLPFRPFSLQDHRPIQFHLRGLPFAKRPISVRSPTPPFGCAGSLLRGPSAGQFRSGPAGGSDLSLARNDCLFPSHRYEVKVPGLLLPCRASLSWKPFGSSAPSPAAVCTRCGRNQYGEPVLPFRTRAFGRPSDLHSPSGFFVPSGSKRSTGLQPRSPPSVRARWSFAPRSPSM